MKAPKKHRRLLTFALAATLSSVVSAPAWCEDASGEPLQLALRDRLDRSLLVEAVLARNPGLRAARRAWEAASYRPQQARSLPDARLAYSFAPASIDDDDVRYGQVLRYAQRLPYGGTRRLRAEQATAAASESFHDLEAMRLSLAAAASMLYDDYYVVERAIEINEEHIMLLETLQRIATARYAAGEAPQQAPLQAEVEAAHLIHRRVVLHTDRRQIVYRINALLHRPPEAELPPAPAELEPPAFEHADSQAYVREALASRPELRALAAGRSARELEVELAGIAFRPDFEVFGSYDSMWDRSEHRVMVGVEINLPTKRDRLRAARYEADAEVARQQDLIDDATDTIRAEVAGLAAELEEAEHVVRLYRSRVLPAAADQVAAADAGFRTGQHGFQPLIDAVRTQWTDRLLYEQALAEVSRKRSELAVAIGRAPVPGMAGARPAPPTEDAVNATGESS